MEDEIRPDPRTEWYFNPIICNSRHADAHNNDDTSWPRRSTAPNENPSSSRRTSDLTSNTGLGDARKVYLHCFYNSWRDTWSDTHRAPSYYYNVVATARKSRHRRKHNNITLYYNILSCSTIRMGIRVQRPLTGIIIHCISVDCIGLVDRK